MKYGALFHAILTRVVCWWCPAREEALGVSWDGKTRVVEAVFALERAAILPT
jgi:hypothetical protein